MNTSENTAIIESQVAEAEGQDSTCTPLKLSYSFKRKNDTAENRKVGNGEREIKFEREEVKDANGIVVKISIKRKTENYTLTMPTIESLGIVVNPEDKESIAQGQCLQRMITDAIESLGRSLVDAGIVLTQENCNWQEAIKFVNEKTSSTKTRGGRFTKDLVASALISFETYLKKTGKPANGIAVMIKMMKARFSPASICNHVKGLHLVQRNLIKWISDGCDETEQEVYADFALAMNSKIEEFLNPPETEDMF